MQWSTPTGNDWDPHIEAAPVANGAVITNWQAHDAGHYFPLVSCPPATAEALRRRYADDPVDPND